MFNSECQESVSVDNPTVDFLVSAIVKSIPSDSTKPTPGALCALGFANAFDQLFVLARPPNSLHLSFTYPQLRKRHPTFFNAIVPFTLGVSTEEQIRSIEQSFPRCQCNVRTNALLRDIHHRDDPRDFLQRVGSGAFDFLQGLVSLSTESLFRSMEGDVKGQKKKGNALKEVSKYLLQEAHTSDTIHACFCWYKATKNESILHFIGQCFERHPTAFRTPACAPEGQEFLYTVASDLRDMIIHMKQDPSSINLLTIKDVVVVINFLKAFMLDLLPPSAKFEHSCAPVVQEVSILFFIEMLDNLDPVKKDLLIHLKVPQLLAGIAIQSVHFMIGDLPYADKIVPYFSGAMQLGDIKQPYAEGWMTLSTIKERKQCANPGCGISPLEHRFPKCARCGVPSYCSRKCQMEAWSHPACSHRSVCKDWDTMMKNCPDLSELRGLLRDPNPRNNAKLKAFIEPLGISESRMMEIKKHSEAFFRATREIPPGMEELRIPASLRSADLERTSSASVVVTAPTAARAKELSPPSLTSQALPRLRGMFNKPSNSGGV